MTGMKRIRDAAKEPIPHGRRVIAWHSLLSQWMLIKTLERDGVSYAEADWGLFCYAKLFTYWMDDSPPNPQ